MDWLGIKEFLKDSLIFIAVGAGMFLFLLYVTIFTQIVGPSMEPLFSDKDVVIVSKLYRNIKYNDIVIFHYEDSKNMVKRIVGLPGDGIKIIDNKIYRNNELIIEDYILSENNQEIVNATYEIIPEDEYFVLGDNRDNSLDSRSFGNIKKDSIAGKVILRLWPVTKIKIVR